LTSYTISKYLKNCFLLLIPVIVWNIIFRPLSPEFFHGKTYWNEVPHFLMWAENILMIIVLALPVFMPLKIKKKSQKAGLVVYLTGLVVYLFAWRPLVLYPDGDWSNTTAGFIVPAISLLFILTGIGLIGNRLFLKIRYNKFIYIIISWIYIMLHISHLFICYSSN